jgi:hypothetical protein
MNIKIGCILLLNLLIVNFSSAQQRSLKFDMKYQVISNNFLIVNDSLDHKMGSAAGSGIAMMRDGTNAEVKIFFIYDYTSGNGNFTEYYILTFPDGSKITIGVQGKSMGSVEGKDPLFSGTVNVIGGTGIYDGAQGYGSMTGNRRDELKSGTVVKLSFDITLK